MSESKRINVPITPEEGLKLLGLTEHPGYPVLVKILSFGANETVLNALDGDMADTGKIVANVQIASGVKSFYQKVCSTVDWIVQETAYDKANPSVVEGEE